MFIFHETFSNFRFSFKEQSKSVYTKNKALDRLYSISNNKITLFTGLKIFRKK